MLPDSKARETSVDPRKSVVVQAPAGSGKTSLLVERYLRLLETVEEPEQILAITFTNKAAAEMRERIVEYLNPSFNPKNRREVEIGKRISRVRGKVDGWGLLANPQRLLIRTIDSFNYYLVRQMPVASALGVVPSPDSSPEELYRNATRNVLELLRKDDEISADLECLLNWRDNRQQDVEDILAGLLGKRDQWLRVLGAENEVNRKRLEEGLTILIQDHLVEMESLLRSVCSEVGFEEKEILELIRYAANNLSSVSESSVLLSLKNQTNFPGARAENLQLWRGFCDFFLTKGRNVRFRRRVSKAQGFLPNTSEKERFTELLMRIESQGDLARLMDRSRNLPDPCYSDEEWRVLQAIIRVLKRAAAELVMVSGIENKIDFSGISLAALRALGDEEIGITDLSLYLDNQINHLLVDEFQDTSWLQLNLIERLTAGWYPGDGRTLFVVGDPMQSIYRFRDADVGLFIKLRDKGINSLAIEPERLSVNFRSNEEIVDWVNSRLGSIFPKKEDISAGSISFTPSVSQCGPGGKVEMIASENDIEEARSIVQLCSSELSKSSGDPDFRIAVLVRARSHLNHIIAEFNQHKIPYRALQLDSLLSSPVIQDLIALTRAIILPSDRTALLSLFRSPMCGLTLRELEVLSSGSKLLDFDSSAEELSISSGIRAKRILAGLKATQEEWRRRPIRDLVEGFWHRLGGPSMVSDQELDLHHAECYFELLEESEQDGSLFDWPRFLGRLQKKYVDGKPNFGVAVDLVTMHAAKGLEWDVVIVPCLERSSRGGDQTLLHWLPFTGKEGEEEILLAPLRASHSPSDSALVNLIKEERRSRDTFENKRLLYVAATRAKRMLVLSAQIKSAISEFRPRSGSFLSAIWETTGHDFRAALQKLNGDRLVSGTLELPARSAANLVARAELDWQPSIDPSLKWDGLTARSEVNSEVEYDWAGVSARQIGIVLHRLLEIVGNRGIEEFDMASRMSLIEKIPSFLRSIGMHEDIISPSTETISKAFIRTLDNEIGSWLLSGLHHDAFSELPISGLIDGELVHAIIDRTFIDQDNTRWIIDYKSGYHSGSNLDKFLDEEVLRYSDQLRFYARLMSGLGDYQIRAALYLPRHDILKEIPVEIT